MSVNPNYFCSFIQARPLAKITTSLINEKKLMNVEHRTSNNVFYLF
ncbi:hypothetical protein D1AOALGA4SA_12548 [Olavius algarvensis Delta 1 endosymbiont]|nr:hypothetical protein D1AOALGA4SA_12548 [Olavius algarvensis Delta 1 endosymbiont]